METLEIPVSLPDECTNRAALYAALSKAQGEFKNPPKTRSANIRSKKGEDSSYGYKYADLSDVIDAIRPTMAKHGLGHVHIIKALDERNTLITRIIHQDGGSIESSMALPRGVTAQEFGAAVTYGRRYSLCALLGIAAETDTDAADVPDGQSDEDADRTTLIEAMATENMGNKAIFDACLECAIELPRKVKSVEDLPYSTVKEIMVKWDNIVKAHKAVEKVPMDFTTKAADPAPAKAKTAPAKKVEVAEPVTEAGDVFAGIDADLTVMMKEAGVEPSQLQRYYTSLGHIPEGVKPHELPATYVKALCTNWAKALTKIKGA